MNTTVSIQAKGFYHDLLGLYHCSKKHSDRFSDKDGRVYVAASLRYMAAKVGKSISSISRYLKELVAAGILFIKRIGRERPNHIYFPGYENAVSGKKEEAAQQMTIADAVQVKKEDPIKTIIAGAENHAAEAKAEEEKALKAEPVQTPVKSSTIETAAAGSAENVCLSDKQIEDTQMRFAENSAALAAKSVYDDNKLMQIDAAMTLKKNELLKDDLAKEIMTEAMAIIHGANRDHAEIVSGLTLEGIANVTARIREKEKTGEIKHRKAYINKTIRAEAAINRVTKKVYLSYKNQMNRIIYGGSGAGHGDGDY